MPPLALINDRFGGREGLSAAKMKNFAQYQQFQLEVGSINEAYRGGSPPQEARRAFKRQEPSLTQEPEPISTRLDSLARKHNAVLGAQHDPLAKASILDIEASLWDGTIRSRTIMLSALWAVVIVALASYLLFWTFDESANTGAVDDATDDVATIDDDDSVEEEDPTNVMWLIALILTASLGKSCAVVGQTFFHLPLFVQVCSCVAALVLSIS